MTKQQFANIAHGPSNAVALRLREHWAKVSAIARPQAAANTILLYGAIGEDWFAEDGGLTHEAVTASLAELGDSAMEVVVRINSPGGDVFEGVGIYNALLIWQAAIPGRKILVKIDALAASIASIIAMAGDDIAIAGNGMVMIHRASTMAWGNAAAMLAVADVLDKIDATIVNTYAERTGQTPEALKAWLDGETYMTAAEAVERGFADRVEALKARPAAADPAPNSGADNQSAARLAAARLSQARLAQDSLVHRLSN